MCKVFNIRVVEVSKSKQMLIHVHVFIYNSESKDIYKLYKRDKLFNSTSNVNKVFVAAVVIGVFNVVSYMLSV